MRVIFSKDWNAARASGQSRLVSESWLEALASDVSPAYWPQLCSSLQLLHNLRHILQQIAAGVLRAYHAREAAREILDRAESNPWFVEAYPVEWELVKAELQELRKAEDRESAVHQSARLLVAAFVDKAENADPIRCQMQAIVRLTLDDKTSFDVLARAVGELTNDLAHRGHSRGFLHDWLLRNVLADNGESYIANFITGKGLGKTSASDYSVVFGTFATLHVPNSDRVQFLDAVPPGWNIPNDSVLAGGNYRLALVRAAGCLDWQAAVEQSRAELIRYLGSIPLAKWKFDRALTDCAAVLREPDGPMLHQERNRRLFERSIQGAGRFYELRQQACNAQTYAELDRVMYWYEQSRGWDDLGRLIALWTALEFLFGQLDESSVKGIQIGVPAYVVPQFARLLILDLRAFLNRIEFNWPDDLLTRLQATAPERRFKTMNLDGLLALCWEDKATNPLMALVKDYPNLTRKVYRIRRLQHPFKKSTDHPAIWHDVHAFEENLLHDLQFAYRARNEIVHAAAIQIVQLDRLVQRLNWVLCTTMDTLIHQFANNPTRALRELHEANLGSYRLWKGTLKSEKAPVPLSDILHPTCHGLPTRIGGQP